jgi:hypothetical protein
MTDRYENIRKAERDALAAALTAQPAADKFVATFRCESNGIVGSMNAPIHNVSMHDDGVIEVVIDHWPEQPASVGEEIMVNAAHDVFILPLQPSGLDGSGPRFVVHVPQTEAQPAAVDEAAATRAFEEHFQASSDDPYFERELELWLTAWRKALAAQQQGGRADG